MTNLEWLCKQSPEDLAVLLFDKQCLICAYINKRCPVLPNGAMNCKKGFVEWAKQEHKPTYRVNWCVHCGGHFDIKANSDEEAIQMTQKEKLPEILNDIKNDISFGIDGRLLKKVKWNDKS